MMVEATTFRRSLAYASMLTLVGCAQEGVSRPTFVGLSDLASSESSIVSADARAQEPLEGLRHVESNKVLAAMAFQKVTGQDVDPESLSGRGE
jgi:hypothetical protein